MCDTTIIEIDVKIVRDDPSIVDWDTIKVGENILLFNDLIDEINAENVIKTLDLFIYVAEQGHTFLAAPFLRDLVMRARNRKVVGDIKLLESKEKFIQLMEAFKDVTRFSYEP